jgi:5-methylcytosine-specific restriction endonuclease McrA
MRLRTCAVCGTPTREARCPRHQLAPRARGRAFDQTRAAVAARDHWTCGICGGPIDPALRRPHPDALHIDHVEPRAGGGSDAPSNLRATHARCNLARTV